MPFRFFRAFAVAAALGTVVSTVPSVAVHSTGVSCLIKPSEPAVGG